MSVATATRTVTAAEIEVGDSTLIPNAGRISEKRVLGEGSRFPGMIFLSWSMALDDSRNHWRIFPADHAFEVRVPECP